jgi:hypothetical protein
MLDRPVVEMTMTPEESEMKQLALERTQALYRKEHGFKIAY